MNDPLLAALMGQLELALRQSWHSRRPGTKQPRSKSRRNVTRRRQRRLHGDHYDWDRGSTVRERVRIAMAQGTTAREAERTVREESRRREVAVLELLGRLVGRIHELLGDTDPGPAYGELIRRAEHRLTHPARTLTGLSVQQKKKISDSLKKKGEE